MQLIETYRFNFSMCPNDVSFMYKDIPCDNSGGRIIMQKYSSWKVPSSNFVKLTIEDNNAID